MQYSECVHFHSRQGTTMPHGRPLQREVTLPWMVKGHAMDTAFPAILGINSRRAITELTSP